jgi:EmrB/QacA subfamily drug resistance transporter
MGDRFGRKRIFVYGILVFVLGSILSGFSGRIGHLIAFQGLQRAGAATMIPGSLAAINASFPQSARGRAIGLWAGLSGGVASLGPFGGGWLVENLGWRSIFFITVPIGVAAFLAAVFFVPESKNPEARRLDWPGTLAIASGLFGLSFGPISGPYSGWRSQGVLLGLVLGAGALVLFTITEVRAREPIVPLSIFRNPLVTGANLVTLFLYFALYGLIFFLVLNMQQVQGYSPVFAGLALLPPIIVITVFAGPAGSLADRIGPRPQMMMGPALVSVGMATLVLPGSSVTYVLHFMPGLVLVGAGMALVIAPLTKCALSVDEKHSGAASGINNAISRIAALMAVAVLGAVLFSLFAGHLGEAIGASILNPLEQKQILGQANRLAAIYIPTTFSQTAPETATNAVKESFIYGFRRAIPRSSFQNR